jgi:hypothetical protein
MTSFRCNIEPAFHRELAASEAAQDAQTKFAYLEPAHVLGQTSTVLHVIAHIRMAVWAIREQNVREFFGQFVRIIGATVATPFGWVPTGNTGGANVSPFKPLPIAADLAAEIESAHRTS